jgi:hypothetical protein
MAGRAGAELAATPAVFQATAPASERLRDGEPQECIVGQSVPVPFADCRRRITRITYCRRPMNERAKGAASSRFFQAQYQTRQGASDGEAEKRIIGQTPPVASASYSRSVARTAFAEESVDIDLIHAYITVERDSESMGEFARPCALPSFCSANTVGGLEARNSCTSHG